MAYPLGIIEFTLLATMRRAERSLAQVPLMLTMLPGPPSQKSAVAAVAVGTQARDSVKRQQRVAEAAVEAVTSALTSSADVTVGELEQVPVLKDIVTPDLVDRINAVTPAVSEHLVKLAGELAVATLEQPKGDRLNAAEAKPHEEIINLLDDATRDKLVR